MVILIENWAVTIPPNPNPYQDPRHSLCLTGDVTGHPMMGDGRLRTSPIKFVNGRLVTTLSGTVYQLGEPDPTYVAWCEKKGVHVPTEEEPIRVVD